MRHPAADDGRHPHHGLRVVVEPVDPGEQQPGEVGGVGPATVVGRDRELLGEEGVALGALGHALDEVVGEVGPGPADDAAQVGLGQGAELDAGQAGQARPHGERPGERVAAVHVVAAVGDEQADAGGKATGEEQGQQVAGGLVGPVHVLDDDEERAAAPEVREGAVHGLDEVGAHGVLAGPGRHSRHERHQAGVVGDQVVDELALSAVEGREHLDERAGTGGWCRPRRRSARRASAGRRRVGRRARPPRSCRCRRRRRAGRRPRPRRPRRGRRGCAGPPRGDRPARSWFSAARCRSWHWAPTPRCSRVARATGHRRAGLRVVA